MLADKEGKKLDKYITDYVLFDLETTGISSSYDEVIEISALRVRNSRIEEEFSTLVNPGRSIPGAATAVNGITNAMVKNSPDFCSVLGDFLDFVGDLVLVGHNIQSFDMKFLYRDCRKYFGKVPDNDYIDTYRLARSLLPELHHYRLVDLAGYYQISAEGAHRALNDCRMNQLVFEQLGKERKRAEARSERLCPYCGGLLQKRSGRFGLFWGCEAYPKCRYTRKYSD